MAAQRTCHFGLVLSTGPDADTTARPPSAQTAPTKDALRRLRAALSKDLGIPVRTHTYRSYGALVKRLDYGVVDLAWLPPLVALRAMAQSSALPVAVSVRGQAQWFWSALFVRSDSPVRTLADLAGSHAVWVDRESASGYLLPRAALRAAGVRVDDVFASETFVKTHDEVARRVLASTQTVGATYVHLDEDGQVQRAAWGDADVRRLKSSGPIPSDLIAGSSGAESAMIHAVRTALLDESTETSAAARALFSATRFADVDTAHTANLSALARSLFGTVAR